MRADKVLMAIIAREGLEEREIAARLGKSPQYLNGIKFRHSIPKADTMAEIADKVGYDLLVRSREDGFEIEVDPKS